MTRPDVVLIATHIAPARGFGGVAESAAALARAWAQQERRFSVAASDGSCGPSITPADVGLPQSTPVRLYRAHWAMRWGFGLGAPVALWKACREASTAYVCGIATWPTTWAYVCCRLLGRPYVAAPRGGLMPAHVAHIRRHKPLKWLFYLLFVLPALRRARAVHAAGDPERDGVRALLPDVRVEVIPNGVDIAFWRAPPRRRAAGDGVRFCYVGRLSPEKGILSFLRVWLAARSPGDSLTIVGDGDGDYADAVRRTAQSSGGAAVMAGVTDRSGVRAALAACDFVVLPSGMEAGDVRENFGNALAEGLAVGRPALVVRGLAWDELAATGAGILFDPTDDGAGAAVRQAGAISLDAYAAMAAAASAFAASRLDLDVAAARLWRVVAPRALPFG
jgi:glycosyltransferase involved in cell wall biosynthesis